MKERNTKMKEAILEILNEINPDIDYENESHLVASGKLDSMTIVLLASQLSDEFDVDLKVTDLVPENFDSVDGMVKMIIRLQEDDI